MKVALVHDWLITVRGGEKVLEEICKLYPNADLFTLFHEPGSMPSAIEQMHIKTAFVDRIPGSRRRHRHFLPFMPAAIESFSLDKYDLIISSSHCVAKGVRKPTHARHLSYVHAPMRYMWDRFDDYFGRGRASLVTRATARAIRPWLQHWDLQSAKSVDRFVANSHYIAQKIARLYGRQASVVYPPVCLDRFCATSIERGGKGGYFLWLGAFAPYKRADLAVEAFRRIGAPLWMGGSGQDAARLSASLPANVRMLGHIDDAELPELYRNARALVFTGEEDLGLTPIEMQACGRPVIAYGQGGALETVTNKTGLFFMEQTPEALCDAVQAFEQWETRFKPVDARTNALRFSQETFREHLRHEIDGLGLKCRGFDKLFET